MGPHVLPYRDNSPVTIVLWREPESPKETQASPERRNKLHKDVVPGRIHIQDPCDSYSIISVMVLIIWYNVPLDTTLQQYSQQYGAIRRHHWAACGVITYPSLESPHEDKVYSWPARSINTFNRRQ